MKEHDDPADGHPLLSQRRVDADRSNHGVGQPGNKNILFNAAIRLRRRNLRTRDGDLKRVKPEADGHRPREIPNIRIESSRAMSHIL